MNHLTEFVNTERTTLDKRSTLIGNLDHPLSNQPGFVDDSHRIVGNWIGRNHKRFMNRYLKSFYPGYVAKTNHRFYSLLNDKNRRLGRPGVDIVECSFKT